MYKIKGIKYIKAHLAKISVKISMALYIFILVSFDKLDYSSKTWNTIHNFLPWFSLEMLTLVAQSQSQSADLSWHIS